MLHMAKHQTNHSYSIFKVTTLENWNGSLQLHNTEYVHSVQLWWMLPVQGKVHRYLFRVLDLSKVILYIGK